ncbi:MAG: response regulator [Bacteroidota bacterium]|nr:response regulator [Bacteroidota bacterium]
MAEIDPRLSIEHYSDPVDFKTLLLDEHFVQQNSVPDLMIIDLNMPKKNGHELVAEIRKIQAFEDVPILIYSTSSQPTDIAVARAQGCQGYIVKPLSIDSLAKTLTVVYRTFLGSPQSNTEFMLF